MDVNHQADADAATEAGPTVFDDSVRTRSREGTETGASASHNSGIGPPAPEGAAFPVRDWDRYEPVRLLGQGGMGTVFLVQDRRLHRQVALKFVRGDNSRHTAQLLVEARAQARVSHDRVCKVFDVGEIQGQVYIAMQFIDGQPLSVAAKELSFEQRALVIRDAAEGVHEAHRAGIIHRDIKPGNIMVERGEAGQIKTFVMDFGIARDPTADQAERTGAVMGTPHYMAPEQARGEVGRLDRRADVYSLGATLYQTLCGQPPVPGTNNLEVLNNIASVEPRPLRALDKDVPPDLEAIANKCLEKERSARYDSARALVEDLDRFLNGEPVQASRAGAWYRLRKRIRKHRRLVIAGASAALLLALALGWGLKTRSESAQRVRLASRFSERVEQIEALARYSALSRIHDIRGDRAKIYAEMRKIEAEIKASGPLAAGPGAYAIGRGYLALGDDTKARASLESAWEGGFRDPRAAYALALVFGHLYQRELVEAERIRDDTLRARRKAEIEAQYRAPALRYLQQSQGANVPSQEYVDALMAYYEGRLKQALQHLDAIGQRLPWFYEAPELRGNVLMARANLAVQNGDRGAARQDLEAGRKAYALACSIAESVPGVWEAAGELEFREMAIELYGEGNVDPPYRRGIAATSRALAADPDDSASLLLAARLRESLVEYRLRRGEDVHELVQQAVAAAAQAVATSPSNALAQLELSRTHRQWGEVQAALGKDPSVELRKSLEAAETISARDHSDEFYLNRGLTFKVWADYQDSIGQSSLENRDKAIEAYAAAIELNPRSPKSFINLAANYQERANQARCRDPDRDLQKAVAALDRALALSPEHLAVHHYLGNAHRMIGLRQRVRGENPKPEFLRAESAYAKGLSINPQSSFLNTDLGLLSLDEAREAWDCGESPESFLDQAKAAFDKSIAAAPDQGWGYNGLGLTLFQRAEVRRALGEDPGEVLHAASLAFREAIQRLPLNPEGWMNAARLDVLIAENEFERDRDPAPAIADAMTAAGKALEINPKMPEANGALGEARGILARSRAAQGKGREADFESAAQAYRRALELDPANQDFQLRLGWFCRAWAEWRTASGQEADSVLAEGLTAVNAVLTARPAWAEARALRGGLTLIQARHAKSPEVSRRKLAAKALEDLTAALRTNPNLERRWSKEAAAASRLAGLP